MPAAQQNQLVQTYCAVCHTDTSRNGGLSLEHFDAAHANPGVAAMLLSKLTSLSPADIKASHHDPSVAANVASRMQTGAMGAAGVPVPDRATQAALVDALAEESAGATAWTWDKTEHASAPTIQTASILPEISSPKYAGDTDMYRLTLTCHADTHEAEMLLAWAPGVPPKGQKMLVSPDGKTPVTYKIEGSEKMGDGTGALTGTGSKVLAVAPLPAKTLTVTNLFPGETIVFPFGKLPKAMRNALSPCFNSNLSKR